MAIAEILQEIKDAETKRNALQSELQKNAFILTVDEKRLRSIDDLLTTFDTLNTKILAMKVALQKTNAITIEPETGMTLVEILKTAEHNRTLESLYRRHIETITTKDHRYMTRGYTETPIELIPNFNRTVEEYENLAEKYKNETRRLERLLQKVNWSVVVSV